MGTTVDKLSAILNSKNAIRDKFNLPADMPFSQYAENIKAGNDGSTEYYKCDAVGPAEDTPTVPDFPQSTAMPEEYLLVSGCSVSDANGVYKLKDRNAVGYERQWAKMSGGATFLGDAENGCYALMYDGGETMMVILSGDSPIGSYTDNLPNGTENGVVVTQYEEEYVYQFKIEGEAGKPSCLGEYTLEDTSQMADWRKWVNSNEKAYVDWMTDRWYIYTTDEGWDMPCYQSSTTTADVPPTDGGLTWTTAAGTTPIPTISPVGTSGDSSSGNSTDIIVSGAVVSGTNGDPNGTYSLIDPEKTGKERQWRNESGCWIIWQSYSDEDDAPGFWALNDLDPYDANFPGEWIFVGSDQYEGTAESPIDETWKNGNFEGYGDTLPTFKWASSEEPETPELAPFTWNGYKAILDAEGYYTFEETLTDGLTYGNGFTPVKDGIYDREALVKIEALFSGSAKYAANETVVAVMPSTSTKMYTKFKIDISSNAIVDWGDGAVETLTNSGEYQHEYAEADKEYIVKIGGDGVNSINFIDPQYSNWSDTTVKRLIQLGNSLTSMYKMFTSTSLQRIENSCQIPENVESMNYAFGTDNLEYAPASLRLPDRCTDFENVFVNARKLQADITNWFDNFTAGGKDMRYAFYYGSELVGTPNGNKLWNSGWSWNGTSSCFKNCSKLSNFNDIPSDWK